MAKNNETLTSSAIGLTAGFVNGLFGSGGGALVVPAAGKFLGLAAHNAHATAVAAMLPMSIVSAAVYIRGAGTPWSAAIAVSAGGIAGGLIGAKLLPKTPASALHKLFGFFMAIAGVRMLF